MNDESPETAASEETKRKFREALERKRNGHTNPTGHTGGESAVRGVHAKADLKREFRRKSG